MPGVDQHHVQMRFQAAIERLPVVAARVHHHQGDLFDPQVIAQRSCLTSMIGFPSVIVEKGMVAVAGGIGRQNWSLTHVLSRQHSTN